MLLNPKHKTQRAKKGGKKGGDVGDLRGTYHHPVSSSPVSPVAILLYWPYAANGKTASRNKLTIQKNKNSVQTNFKFFYPTSTPPLSATAYSFQAGCSLRACGIVFEKSVAAIKDRHA
jgi:hypothetical protein